MNSKSLLVAIFMLCHLIFLTFCISVVSGVQVDCEPDSSNGPLNAGASCLHVKDEEESCNGDHPFRSGDKRTDCFGSNIGKWLEIGPKQSKDCLRRPVYTSQLNFTYRFIPHNLLYYNLSLSIDFRSNTDLDTYALLLKYVHKDYYFCVNVDETTLNLTLPYPRRDQKSEIILMDPLPYTFQSPRHCADTEHIPYDPDTCGLPQLEKPRNVVLQCNETHTKISWDPACYVEPGTGECIEPDQQTYYLTLGAGERNSSYFTIHNTTAVTVNISNTMIRLYAYSPCSGFFQEKYGSPLNTIIGCSRPVIFTNRYGSDCTTSFLTSCFTPTPTPSPIIETDPSTSSSHNDQVVYGITACVAGLAILVTTLVVIVVIHYKRKKATLMSGYVQVQQESPSLHDCSALVVYSSSTPELEKRVIMQKLGPDLQNMEKGIDSCLQDTRKPQENMIGWITEHHHKANAVFCVCNQEFSRDWENSFSESSDSDVAVRTLRQLFEGELQRGPEAVKKYAIVLPKPTDNVFIPAILQKQCQFDMSDTNCLTVFARLELQSVSESAAQV